MAEKRVIQKGKENELECNRTLIVYYVLNTSTTSSIEAENYSDAETDNFNILNLFTEQEMNEIDSHHGTEGIVAGSSTVDEVDSYCVELVGHNGITTLNIICFLLHDYSLNENILLAKTFVLITRRPHKFPCGDIKWSYACSCSRRIAELLKSGVAFIVEMPYDDFVDKYETCIHVQALKKIMCGFDSQNDIDATQFTVSDIVQHSNDQELSTVHSVAGSPYLLCVLLEASFGVVSWERDELKCSVCSGLLSGSCDHVKEVNKILEDDGETPDFVLSFMEYRYDRVGVGAKASWFLHAKSYMPIPFILPERLKQIMFETSECQIEMNQEGARLTQSIPEASTKLPVCPSCGSPWRPESPTLHDWLSETCNIILR
ncbi:Hypothetical predicted protein, partial [Paramuricea clavata]